MKTPDEARKHIGQWLLGLGLMRWEYTDEMVAELVDKIYGENTATVEWRGSFTHPETLFPRVEHTSITWNTREAAERWLRWALKAIPKLNPYLETRVLISGGEWEGCVLDTDLLEDGMAVTTGNQ